MTTGKKIKQVKTRFPPSPTGPLHMGTARTALFNYLFAKKNQGKLVFRFEDTDKERSKKEFETEITERIKWLGLSWDEGPIRQSERTEIYSKCLKLLLDNNKAYFCFCTQEELEAQRQDMESRGVVPRYSGTCASLDKKQVEENIKKEIPSVIRFRMPPRKFKFTDLVRGEVEMDGALIGDFIIAKGLDHPLYHFAVIVDDHEMEITHVIRGEDLLPSTPKHLAILDALNWEHPHFAHLPLILNPDRSKMSKRFLDTAVSDYQKQGYLPEAIINFVALLGWNPGTDQELFTLEELVKEFSLEKVQKSGAVFNIEKLQWFNAQYIKRKSRQELALLCFPYWQEAGLLESQGAQKEGHLRAGAKVPFKAAFGGITLEWLAKVAGLFQERLKILSEIAELSRFLFTSLPEYDKDLLRWKETSWEVITDNLQWVRLTVKALPTGKFNVKTIEGALMNGAKERGVGETLWPLRVALSGLKASPGPFEIMEVLGKEGSLKRIDNALAKLM